MAICMICRTHDAVTGFECDPHEVEVAPGEVFFVPRFAACPRCAALVRACDYEALGDQMAHASVAAVGTDPGRLLVEATRRLSAALVACAVEM